MPCLILIHDIRNIYQLQLRQHIDRLLRISLFIFIVSLIVSIGYLSLENHTLILSYSSAFALIQFLILVLHAGILILLLCCTFQDIFHPLHQERNLDPLTGLLNRRALHEYLAKRPTQPSTAYALLLCDLDYFKRINDQYGHQVGDLALIHISEILKQTLAVPNQIARIGGEEFVILIPNQPQAFALALAEKLRLNLANTPLYIHDEKIEFSMSIGVSFFQHPVEFSAAMQQADALLYQAKAFGRNQVHWPAKNL